MPHKSPNPADPPQRDFLIPLPTEREISLERSPSAPPNLLNLTQRRKGLAEIILNAVHGNAD